MSLIEGFGDEVTIFLLCVLIVFVLLLAWFSTNVSENSTISVIVLDRQGFQRFLARISALTARGIQARFQAAPTGENNEQPTPVEEATESTPETAEVNADQPTADPNLQSLTTPPVEGASSNNDSETSTREAGETTTRETTPETTPEVADPSGDQELLNPDLLRKTRLAFFEKLGNQGQNNEAVSSDTATEPAETVSSDHNDPTASSTVTTESPPGGETSSDVAPGNQANPEEVEPQRLAGHIRIRLKFLSENQKYVQAKPQDTIGDFKRTHFARELAENLIVRCIHNGQELRPDSTTLESYNISDRSVIHCLSQARPPPEVAPPPEREELDLGALMFPLFAVVLVAVWYARFTYKLYFNAMSTFCLIGITMLFVVAGLATWRTHERPHPHRE